MARNTNNQSEAAPALNSEKFMSQYERGLLSLALRNLDLLTELDQVITSDYFLLPGHSIIYIALTSLLRQENLKKIDLESLYIECEKLNISHYGIQPEYIKILSSGGFDKENFQFYLDKVRNSYLKYTLSRKLEENYKYLLNNIEEDATPAEELVSKISSDLSELSAYGEVSEAAELSKEVRIFVTSRAEDPKAIMGLETGIPSLDMAINGLMPGTVTCVAGEAKAGKSTLMLNMVDYIVHESSKRVPVLYISTEMYKEEDLSRLVAMRSLIKEREIFNGIAYNEENKRAILDTAITQIENSNVYHMYLPDFSSAKISNLIYQFKIKYNIGLAVFDYIKMITTGDEARDKREDQVLGDVTNALKMSGGKLHIPILTGCQINTRSGKIADSDRILRYCNTLIQFSSKTQKEIDKQAEGEVDRRAGCKKYGSHWITVYRTRAGGDGRIPVRFWKHCCKIVEAEQFQVETTSEDEETTLTTPSDWDALLKDKYKIERVVAINKSETIDLEDAPARHPTQQEEDDQF